MNDTGRGAQSPYSRWPRTVREAERIQRELAERVRIPSEVVPSLVTVAGLDVSYSTVSNRLVAAAVVVDLATGATVDQSLVHGVAEFPYVSGFLAFREAPVLLEALSHLRITPDVLLCDGQGVAHPRRCGLACHLGVLADAPSVGCAKTWLTGEHVEPGPRRGDRSPLFDGGDLVGYALRTQDEVRPVYVSPGNAIGFDQACEVLLATCSAYRIPDPLRFADQLSRRELAARD